MGRKIITNNKDSWKLYSTVSDDVVAKFETEKDLKNFIANEVIYDGKLKAIEYLMTYPNKWTINDVRIINENKDNLFGYYKWFEEIQDSETYDEYYKKIDDKLEELLNS